MVLDHIIATVPDLRETHARLQAMGFAEAWPPGPFWPSALTSGLALGGVNLELVQPDAGVERMRIDTLVLAPADLEESRRSFDGAAFREVEKVEPDPDLLARRGFPPEMAATPQTICTNFYPESTPYPYFPCVYAPFLRARLAPGEFPAPFGPVVGLALTAEEPEAVRRLFAGRLGPLELDVDPGPNAIMAIRFGDGRTLEGPSLTIA